MEYKDYYETLGVARDASQDEIKRSYRKMARRYHPDVSKETDAAERFTAVQEAYEVLRDPEKRAAYDRLGSDWQPGQEFRPPPGWEAGSEFGGGTGATGFSDFFGALFGGRSPFGHAQGDVRGFDIRGQDHFAHIEITLEQAYSGTSHTVRLQTPEVDAQGRVQVKTRTLNVRVPAGVTEGQQIRLAGQGAPGIGKGRRGDLYLEIGIKPHRLFRADDRDIYFALAISPWEAALGAKLTVPTLGGDVELKIPAGAQSGKKLRLKGRGLPGTPPGDQYVVLRVVVPPANTAQAKELYREMERVMAFDPRART